MIKVIHLITSLGLGGAENQLVQLVTQSDQTRFQHIVISMQDYGVLGSKLQRKGIKLYSLGIRRGVSLIKACLNLYNILRTEKPDILQTWLYHADFLGLLIGKLARVPNIIWNLRCSDMNTSYYSYMTSLVIKICVSISSLPKAIIVNSKAGELVHRKLGYQARNWLMIPNGFKTKTFRLDMQVREKMRASFQFRPEIPIIGMIARYDPMKDHNSFLLAVSLLKYKLPLLKVLLVGSNVDENNTKLMNKILELDLKKDIVLLGSRQDIPDIMNVLDLLVLPSAFGEGFSNVLGEAMASEVPCVSTDTGDSVDIIGDTGKIVPIKNPLALAEAIEALLCLDTQERQNLGRRARQKIIACYDIEHITRQYEMAYESFCLRTEDRLFLKS